MVPDSRCCQLPDRKGSWSAWEESKGLVQLGLGQAQRRLLARQGGIRLSSGVGRAQQFGQRGFPGLERFVDELGAVAHVFQLVGGIAHGRAGQAKVRLVFFSQAQLGGFSDIQLTQRGGLQRRVAAIGAKGNAHANADAALGCLASARRFLAVAQQQLGRIAPGGVDHIHPFARPLHRLSSGCPSPDAASRPANDVDGISISGIASRPVMRQYSQRLAQLGLGIQQFGTRQIASMEAALHVVGQALEVLHLGLGRIGRGEDLDWFAGGHCGG